MLKWNKTFGDHTFDVTFVQNAEKYNTGMNICKDRISSLPMFLVITGCRLQQKSSHTSDDQVSTGDALLARLNYTFKSRYNITGSFRRDGYSAFGQANPRASFWSVAGGWTISEENFFNVDWIDQLKLRFSYGKRNRGVGIYDALSNLNSENSCL